MRGLLLAVYNECFWRDSGIVGGICEPSVVRLNLGEWYNRNQFFSYPEAKKRVEQSLERHMEHLGIDEKKRPHCKEVGLSFFYLASEQEFSEAIFINKQGNIRGNRWIAERFAEGLKKLEEEDKGPSR